MGSIGGRAGESDDPQQAGQAKGNREVAERREPCCKHAARDYGSDGGAQAAPPEPGRGCGK